MLPATSTTSKSHPQCTMQSDERSILALMSEKSGKHTTQAKNGTCDVVKMQTATSSAHESQIYSLFG